MYIFLVVSKLNKGLTLPFDLDDQLKKNEISAMVRRVGDELSLLNIFLSKIAELDPDIILVFFSFIIKNMKTYITKLGLIFSLIFVIIDRQFNFKSYLRLTT